MHGDLTTSNILLRNGNFETIVFIDFGLAEVKIFHVLELYHLQNMNQIFSTFHKKQRSQSWIKINYLIVSNFANMTELFQYFHFK